MKLLSILRPYLISWVAVFTCFSVYAVNQTSTPSKSENKSPIASTPQMAKPTSPGNIIPAPPIIDAKGYILMDANSGLIITGKNIDTPMPPASLTKIMTLYQIANALKESRLHLGDRMPVSEKAWRTGGSKMFIKIGDQVPVTDLIQGIAVVSGNDACVAVAEGIAGSEDSFADLMNKTASTLGMKNTHYTDSTGLPNPQHFTSPRDLAILAQAFITHFPQYYHWYSQKEFEYNGIKQPNRDVLLWRDGAVDGMKTGFTNEAGYCLVSSAQRNGMRLISVIMGASSPKKRAEASLALLNYGFRFYETQKVLPVTPPLKNPRVWYGKNKYTPLGVEKDVYVTLPLGQFKGLKTNIAMQEKIKAPITKGQSYGTIKVVLGDKELLSQPLVALENNPKGGLFSRLIDHVVILVYQPLHKTS